MIPQARNSKAGRLVRAENVSAIDGQMNFVRFRVKFEMSVGKGVATRDGD